MYVWTICTEQGPEIVGFIAESAPVSLVFLFLLRSIRALVFNLIFPNHTISAGLFGNVQSLVCQFDQLVG